ERVLFEQAGKNRRPSKLAISVRAQLGHELRNINAELMGWCILARVITVTAVKTQIREIGQISFGKNAALFHRRKNRAVSLAVSARVANRHLPRAVFDQIKIRHGAPPPARRFFRRPNRWLIRNRPDNLCREYCRPSSRPLQRYSLPAVHRT